MEWSTSWNCQVSFGPPPLQLQMPTAFTPGWYGPFPNTHKLRPSMLERGLTANGPSLVGTFHAGGWRIHVVYIHKSKVGIAFFKCLPGSFVDHHEPIRGERIQKNTGASRSCDRYDRRSPAELRSYLPVAINGEGKLISLWRSARRCDNIYCILSPTRCIRGALLSGNVYIHTIHAAWSSRC